MAVVITNLGPVTAYGDAVAGGYTGTKEQWQALMANYATVGTQAAQSAQTATTKASEASASASTAEAAVEEAQIRYGSPLTATSASDMTDENRVYVYVGNEDGYTHGDWYYHDGSDWVDGGVYNGTGVNVDATLRQSGMPADAKATGDAIAEVDGKLDELTSLETLAITRVISTTYMTDAQLARNYAWKKNGMLFLKFNAEFTNTGYNASSDFQTIAKINGWNALTETFMTMPKQTDGTKIMILRVRSNGEIQVYSTSSISGWYRTGVCVPAST